MLSKKPVVREFSKICAGKLKILGLSKTYFRKFAKGAVVMTLCL